MKNSSESERYRNSPQHETAWDNIGENVEFNGLSSEPDRQNDNSNQYRKTAPLTREEALVANEQATIQRIAQYRERKRQMEKDVGEWYWNPGKMDESFRSYDDDIEHISQSIREEESRLADIREDLYGKNSQQSEPRRHAEQFYNTPEYREKLLEKVVNVAKAANVANSTHIERERSDEPVKSPSERAYDKAWDYVKEYPIPESIANEIYSREHAKVKLLLWNLESIDRPRNKENSILDKYVDKRDRKRVIKELRRYGWHGDSPAGHSEIFKSLKEERPLDRSRLGRERRLDFYIVQNLQKEISKKAYKKAMADLKSQGINKLLKTWRDKDFTSHEINQIKEAMELMSYSDEQRK